MKETAEKLGFEFSRKGCPCQGTPLIYRMTKSNINYQLTIWPVKKQWKLTANGCSVAFGKEDEIEAKITAIWAL